MCDELTNQHMDQNCSELSEQGTSSDYNFFEKAAQNNDFNDLDLPDYFTNSDLTEIDDDIDVILNELVDLEMPIAQPLPPNIIAMNENVTVLRNHQSPHLWANSMELISKETTPSPYIFLAPAASENDTNDLDVGGNEIIEAEDPMMSVMQGNDTFEMVADANNELTFIEISEEFSMSAIQNQNDFLNLIWLPAQLLGDEIYIDTCSTSVPDVSQEEIVETEEMTVEDFDTEGSATNDSIHSTSSSDLASTTTEYPAVRETSTKGRGRPRKPVEVEKRPGQKLTKLELNNKASRKYRHKGSDKKKLLALKLTSAMKRNEHLTRTNEKLAAVIKLFNNLVSQNVHA